MDWQVDNKINISTAAPKGAIGTERFTASLKRCPDTKRNYFGSLFSNLWHKSGSYQGKPSGIPQKH
jgi:hypothetical protein